MRPPTPTEPFGSISVAIDPRFGLCQSRNDRTVRFGGLSGERVHGRQIPPQSATPTSESRANAPRRRQPRRSCRRRRRRSAPRRGRAEARPRAAAPKRSGGIRRFVLPLVLARGDRLRRQVRATTISSKAGSWSRPTTPMSAPTPRSSPPRRRAISCRSPVVDNQVVHQGDLLALIDDGDYQVAVDAAQAKVDTQDATIARFGRQIDAQARGHRPGRGAGRRLAGAAARPPRPTSNARRSNTTARTSSPRPISARSSGSSRRPPTATAPSPRSPAPRRARPRSPPPLEGAKANLDVLKAQRDEASRQRNELMTALAKAKRDLELHPGRRAVRRRGRQQGGRGRQSGRSRERA